MSTKARSLAWLLSVNSLAIPRIASALFSSLILSVAVSKLPLIRLTPKQLSKLEAVQTLFAANLLGVPDTVESYFLYFDLGWYPVVMYVKKAKL